MDNNTNKRAGGEKRGSAADRRARKANLLRHHGDGATAPCCWCGETLTAETLEQDRVIAGGPYRMVNLVPACRECNLRRSDATVEEFLPHCSTPTAALAAIAHAATYRPQGRRVAA